MVNHSSIKHISSLLNNPGAITAGDQSSIASFRQTFPYFVPVRYLSAVESNKSSPFSDVMLSEIQPYLGDWILFCDFLAAGSREQGQEAVAAISHVAEQSKEQGQQAVAAIPLVMEPIVPIVVITEEVIEIETAPEPTVTTPADKKAPFIFPAYTQDYFMQLGEKISEEIPDEIDELIGKDNTGEEDKSLMVMMSFSEWLHHFKSSSEKEEEEKKDQKALKTMWQKEKLAAAMEEENEEIPENVFEMAVNSITREEDLASEPLADIYIKQGKYDQAMEMYRKLSLRNPQKSTYFARKIEEILKEKS